MKTFTSYLKLIHTIPLVIIHMTNFASYFNLIHAIPLVVIHRDNFCLIFWQNSYYSIRANSFSSNYTIYQRLESSAFQYVSGSCTFLFKNLNSIPSIFIPTTPNSLRVFSYTRQTTFMFMTYISRKNDVTISSNRFYLLIFQLKYISFRGE